MLRVRKRGEGGGGKGKKRNCVSQHNVKPEQNKENGTHGYGKGYAKRARDTGIRAKSTDTVLVSK